MESLMRSYGESVPDFDEKLTTPKDYLHFILKILFSKIKDNENQMRDDIDLLNKRIECMLDD